jgi:hypothetical protein
MHLKTLVAIEAMKWMSTRRAKVAVRAPIVHGRIEAAGDHDDDA